MPEPATPPTPPTDEQPAMTVWPTIGATALGRLIGRLCGIRLGLGWFFTVGTLMAVLSIPLSLAVFFWQLMPGVCRRYALSSRRIIIQKGYRGVDDRWIELGQFDAIDVEVLPGQAWLECGEVIFRRSGTEVFRLPGVSRPEVFRQVCLKLQNALLSVQKVLEKQSVS